MFRRTRYYAGVDIGDALVKVVVVGIAGDGCSVVGSASIPTPQGGVVDGVVVGPAVVAGAIREALATGPRVRLSGAIPVVAGNHLVVRTLSLPPMSSSELKEAARWEAAQYLPFPAEEASYDIVEVSQVADLVEALFVGCRASVVDGIVAAIEAAGLSCIAVEPAPVALARLSWRQRTAARPEHAADAEAAATAEHAAIAVLDIGYSSSNVSIFKDGLLRVNRTIPTGSAQVDQTIADGQDMTPGETLRLRSTLLLERRRSAGQAGEAAQGVIADLCREVQRSMDYFRAQHQWSPIDQLVLVGGGSLIGGIESYLHEVLEVPVQRLDLDGLAKRGLRGVESMGQDELAIIGGALGAALREVSRL